jgi:hypothetical protein
MDYECVIYSVSGDEKHISVEKDRLSNVEVLQKKC